MHCDSVSYCRRELFPEWSFPGIVRQAGHTQAKCKDASSVVAPQTVHSCMVTRNAKAPPQVQPRAVGYSPADVVMVNGQKQSLVFPSATTGLGWVISWDLLKVPFLTGLLSLFC